MTIQDTLNQRNSTHGDFRDNGRIMQALKDQIRIFERHDGVKSFDTLPPHFCEALDMICHKIGRILSGNSNEPDHWHDIAGYATLIENELKKPADVRAAV